MPRAGKTEHPIYLYESVGEKRPEKTRRERQEDRPDLLGKYLKKIMRSQERWGSDAGN